METTAQVQPNKSTTMRYRKNTVEEDEQEIQELEKARAGKEEEVENQWNAQKEEKNINILLKSNYILYGILWFEKKKTRQ